MGLSTESKRYPDVIVMITKDVESGIIMSKNYRIIKNDMQVQDNLTVMCLKHDLRCLVYSSKYTSETTIVCMLRSFESIAKMIEHIKTKANKSKYSFRLKGQFALVTIGDKKYIYRITLKKEES